VENGLVATSNIVLFCRINPYSFGMTWEGRLWLCYISLNARPRPLRGRWLTIIKLELSLYCFDKPCGVDNAHPPASASTKVGKHASTERYKQVLAIASLHKRIL